MNATTMRERYRLIDLGGMEPGSFARDVAAGLAERPKRLPCHWRYDRAGSLLFEEICELPEYYLSRAEREILEARAHEIAAVLPGSPGTALIELGSGNAAKTRLVIEACLERHGHVHYVPVDLDPTVLERSSLELLESYSGLEITAVAGEYRAGLEWLRSSGAAPCARLVLWLGSSIGNLHREQAALFLGGVRGLLSARDRLLVGIDLRKARSALERAYDDSRGLSERFNKNVLARINHELGARFDLDAFTYRVVWEEEAGRVRKYLVSRRAQQVGIEALGREISFAAGEEVHMEDSYKYSIEEIAALGAAAGLAIHRQWTDGERRFSSCLFAPA